MIRGTTAGRREAALLAAAGLAAGVVNGLLGNGGGIVLTFAFTRYLAGSCRDKNDIFANVLSAVLPLSIVSSVIYALNGNIGAEGSAGFIVPAIVGAIPGGICGALLLEKLNYRSIRALFSALVIYSGINMLLG